MPPKGRRAHNTRSVSGARARSNSPLVVKVNNDMAKAKQPQQTKAKLKSIVKVVKNTTNAAATKKVSFRQGPAPPVDHQPVEQPAVLPRQTAFADAMAHWKLSMVAVINSCPSPPTSGDQDNQGPQGNNVLLQQSSTVVPEDRSRDHTVQMPVYGQPAMVAPRDAHGRFGVVPGDQDSLDISQPLPSGDVGMDLGVGPANMEMDDEDNPPPPPAGRPNSHPVAAASAPQEALELMSVQQVREQQGKCFRPILSKHMPDNIRRHIWANKYINFQYLIEADPKEEVTYHFVPSTSTNSTSLPITLQPVKPKVKIDGWVAWNKAMRMFIEVYCMKYPGRCMQLLQYTGLLNNLSDKFPFNQVYAYDKEFRAELEWALDTSWNVIDQQLWATTLHGIHTLPHQGNPQQYTFKPRQQHQQQQQQGKGLVRSSDNQFRNCFDFNRGGCTRPSCTFPHVCGRCGSPAHTTAHCPQKKQQQQGAVQPMATTAASRGHVRPANTTQMQTAGRVVAIQSRQ